MSWFNLIWMIPTGVIWSMFLMVFLWQHYLWRKVRRINAKLYGEIVNDCILCPVCEGFIYVNCWQEHLDDGHTNQVHYIEPIEQEFAEARKNL